MSSRDGRILFFLAGQPVLCEVNTCRIRYVFISFRGLSDQVLVT